MVKNLPIKFFGVIIIGVFAFGWAPALAQERADVKEEGGVKVERLASGEIIFPDVVIEGRLERPVALFLKRQQPDFKTVRFNRDFFDDILRPIDKEALDIYTAPKPFDYVKNPLLWMAVATAGTSSAAAGYQAYNGEWPQVRVYGITAGAAAVAAATLVIIDRGLARGAR